MVSIGNTRSTALSGKHVLDRRTSGLVADFVSGVAAAESVADAFSSLSDAAEALGFDSIVYTVIPLSLIAAERVTPVFLASNGFSAGFLKHYLEADLSRHDYTIERAGAGRLEVTDWHEERAGRRLTPEQGGVVDTARFDYGIRSALSIPTLGGRHVVAGACVTSGEGDVAFELLKSERLTTLRSLVEIFHCRVFASAEFRQPFYSTFLDRFTADEAMIVKLIVAGHRLKSSRDLCGISPTRAANIRSSLYRKLGVGNASELAYLVGVHDIARLL